MNSHRPETPTLELRGVSAGYGKALVLRDVDLCVPAGSVVALIGPNGAGKSTLLNTAAGVLRPTRGTVLMGGVDVTRDPSYRRARSGLCYVPEGHSIFPSLSVYENLLLDGRTLSRQAAVDAASTAFPVLAGRLRQQARTLSGGQQQMLALARTALAESSLVLIDEVSVGLAPVLVDEIFESINALRARGTSILLVEQYIQRALEIADMVYLLVQGGIAYSGPPDGLPRAALVEGYIGTESLPKPGGGEE